MDIINLILIYDDDIMVIWYCSNFFEVLVSDILFLKKYFEKDVKFIIWNDLLIFMCYKLSLLIFD